MSARPVRRRRLAASLVLVVALVVGAFAVLSGRDSASGDGEPRAPIPRVCWFSDYAKGRLSNRCTYRSDERRWYIRVDGRDLPADEQRLPPANLCLYFHGTTCPPRKGRDSDHRVPDEGADDDRS